MGDRRCVHVDVTRILKETELAFLLLLENEKEVWVPKSVIQDADDYDEGDENATVSIHEWWAEKNNVE